MRYPVALVAAAAALLLSACENDLLEPTLRGDVTGIVLDFETGAPLAGVSITTSPPSQALVSGDDGTYALASVPAGNYTIAGRLAGYTPNSITVAVQDGETTSAVLFLELEAEEDTTGTRADFEASVLNVTVRQESDSTFATVEYRARNRGETAIATYEIYFQILTSGPTFFEEVSGENLGVGQSDIGEFEQYVGSFEVAAVEVSDVYFDGQE